MDSGFYAAANGALRSELRLAVLSNNLANLNTNGFKQDRIAFGAFMTSVGPEQFPLPNDSLLGLHVPGSIPFPYSNPASNAYSMAYPMARYSVPDLSPGEMRATDNPLHVGIEGEGFLTLNGPDGKRHYTRDGALVTNADGELVTREGYQVLGEGGAPIVVGNGPVSIALDGTVSVGTGVAGRLQLVSLPKEGLIKEGNNRYQLAPGAAEVPVLAVQTKIHQGFLEGSNTDMIRGMTEMVETNRAFETYMKMIQALDGMDAKAANDISRLG